MMDEDGEKDGETEPSTEKESIGTGKESKVKAAVAGELKKDDDDPYAENYTLEEKQGSCVFIFAGALNVFAYLGHWVVPVRVPTHERNLYYNNVCRPKVFKVSDFGKDQLFPFLASSRAESQEDKYKCNEDEVRQSSRKAKDVPGKAPASGCESAAASGKMRKSDGSEVATI